MFSVFEEPVGKNNQPAPTQYEKQKLTNFVLRGMKPDNYHHARKEIMFAMITIFFLMKIIFPASRNMKNKRNILGSNPAPRRRRSPTVTFLYSTVKITTAPSDNLLLTVL